MINITFPDGAVRQYEQGVTAFDIAKSISEGLARKVLAANVNGQVWDATRPINEDATIKLLTWTDGEGQAIFWHSSAHLMAEAVKYFTEKGDEYKLDLLEGLQDGQITFYTQGNFTDLCRGPHIPNTNFIKAIKLTNIAGAYWKGDEKNKQLRSEE